jgi:hypothetical protein
MNKFILLFVIAAAVLIGGCVHYEQSTAVNNDGSAYINIHYWTKLNNLTMDDKKLGKFDFKEKEIKYNYSSVNSEVLSIRVDDDYEDSTKHVWVVVNVKDINKLNEAKGFENVTCSWKETSSGKEFLYSVAMDTTAAKGFDAERTGISYLFDFPGNVLSANTAYTKGKSVKWDFKLSDFMHDVEMRAVVAK